MKNIVFIPYIKREKDLTGKSSIGHSNRHQGYEYGIKSWKSWCDKNSCDLYVMYDILFPERENYTHAFKRSRNREAGSQLNECVR